MGREQMLMASCLCPVALKRITQLSPQKLTQRTACCQNLSWGKVEDLGKMEPFIPTLESVLCCLMACLFCACRLRKHSENSRNQVP